MSESRWHARLAILCRGSAGVPNRTNSGYATLSLPDGILCHGILLDLEENGMATVQSGKRQYRGKLIVQRSEHAPKLPQTEIVSLH